jgi:hypothetical protein
VIGRRKLTWDFSFSIFGVSIRRCLVFKLCRKRWVFPGKIRCSCGTAPLTEKSLVTVNWNCDGGECDECSVETLCLRCKISAVSISSNCVYKPQYIRENECCCDEVVADREGGELRGERLMKWVGGDWRENSEESWAHLSHIDWDGRERQVYILTPSYGWCVQTFPSTHPDLSLGAVTSN